ncbi:hypothetical protein [Kitasatospora sp. NPDC093806]|uniref:hypothetical protein n=1 Tax=Kitasatospora sp. NPDC093806 TaxID=3155075 RepID=UPI0034201C6B
MTQLVAGVSVLLGAVLAAMRYSGPAISRGLLRFARQCLPVEIRSVHGQEWIAELEYILRTSRNHPWRAGLTGPRFSLGLLLHARRLGREYQSDDIDLHAWHLAFAGKNPGRLMRSWQWRHSKYGEIMIAHEFIHHRSGHRFVAHLMVWMRGAVAGGVAWWMLAEANHPSLMVFVTSAATACSAWAILTLAWICAARRIELATDLRSIALLEGMGVDGLGLFCDLMEEIMVQQRSVVGNSSPWRYLRVPIHPSPRQRMRNALRNRDEIEVGQ